MLSQYRKQPSLVPTPGVRKSVCYLMIAALCILAVVAAEVMLRIVPQPMRPKWQIRHVAKRLAHEVVADADVGFLLPRGQRKHIRTQEFAFDRITDSHGFFNPDPWPSMADIVFLGDSLLEGEGVGMDRHFVHLLRSKLPELRIINLGIAAAGAERQYRLYRRFGVPLQPHLVVASLYLVSDLDNDEKFHAWLSDKEGLEYNPFRLSYNRRHDARPPWHPGRFMERSRLYQMGWEVIERWRLGKQALPERFRFADGTEIFLEQAKVQFARDTMAADDARLDPLFASLEQLQTLIRQHDARLLVMLIPSKEELFGTTLSGRDDSVVARVRQRLRSAQMPVLDLYPSLRASGASQSPYFHSDIHLNAHGNRVVAEAFVAWWRTYGATL